MNYLPWLLIGVLVGVFYGCHERSVGAYKERIAQLESRKAQVDTVYRTDTLKLTKTRTKVDSILATDTVWSTDTVSKLVALERLACSDVIESCGHRVAVRDSIITVLKKQKPGRFGCAAGAAVNLKGIGPGVACGLRF